MTWRDAKTERELFAANHRGEIALEEMNEAAVLLVAIKTAAFQAEHPRPKGRVTVCESCCGWSHHGRFCRGCKRCFGEPMWTAVKWAKADLVFNHPVYDPRLNGEYDRLAQPPEKKDAIDYIMRPGGVVGAADRGRRRSTLNSQLSTLTNSPAAACDGP